MPTILDAIEHTKRGRLQEAEAIYLKLLSAQPNDADALHYLGVLRMGQRRREEAIELVSRALKVAPRNAHAWNSLGNMVASTGKLAAAEFAFKSALELQPDFLEAQYNLGNLQRRMRKREEALASFRRVVELNPKLSVAYENIAMLLFRLKRTDEAAAAFRRWSEADPENPIARHMLAAYSNQAPERADDAYVARLFDRMSGYFDESLQRLGYAAPQLLTSALAEIIPFGEKRLVVLDAGVGTGLCGPLLRSSAQRLIGVDLSPGMLTKARERKVYDELHEGELAAFMRAHPAEYDMVISADTLVYFGELEGAFAAAAAALKPGGILAFTVEAEPAGSLEKYRLNQHGRYSHSADYVRECLAQAGLELLQLEAGILRKEMGSDVHGHVVLARKKWGHS
jgi:predicted TPR repeat methyltransferase